MINLGKIRATSIKTVQHLILPPPGNVRQEASLQWQMESMMRAAEEYEKEFCNQKGEPPSSLTSQELRGVKEVRNMVQDGRAVVFPTDKSGMMCIDSLDNYSEALSVHTANAEIIDRKQVEKLETKMNQHLKWDILFTIIQTIFYGLGWKNWL